MNLRWQRNVRNRAVVWRLFTSAQEYFFKRNEKEIKSSTEHPEELAYRCCLSALAGLSKYLPSCTVVIIAVSQAPCQPQSAPNRAKSNKRGH